MGFGEPSAITHRFPADSRETRVPGGDTLGRSEPLARRTSKAASRPKLDKHAEKLIPQEPGSGSCGRNQWPQIRMPFYMKKL